MSCAWSFECLSHTPAIEGEEFTNHTDDHHYKRALELARMRPLDVDWNDVVYNEHDSYERAAKIFLLRHVNCEIGIVNEYGTHLTLDEAEPPSPDIPSWYKVTSRGVTIMMCVVCILSKNDQVLPASTVQNGNAVCIYHVQMKESHDHF